MALKIQDAGTLQTITRGYVMQAGILRTLREIKVMDGGTLRTGAVFSDPLSVSANNCGNAGSGTVTTTESSATVSGGLAPFTYAWTLITNGGGDASTANSPAMASTTFTKTNVTADVVDVWRVTVTDSSGATATDDVNASFVYLSGV